MTASKSLPARPSLESLRKQAKRLARDITAGDADAIARVRVHLPQVEWPLTQRQAQLVIAREYGYAGWHDLTTEVRARLGDGLAWAVTQAQRVIHDNDVERLTQLLADYPALLAWQGDERHGSLLEMATGAYGDAFGAERERSFTRGACAELLLGRGAVVLPRVAEGILRSRAVGLLHLFEREGLLPRTLPFRIALGDLAGVRALLHESAPDAAALTEGFIWACRYEHEEMASLLLERAIDFDPALGGRIDDTTDRQSLIACFMNKTTLDFDDTRVAGLWEVLAIGRVVRALHDRDLASFVNLLKRERWPLGDDYVWLHNDLIAKASVEDGRGAFISALFDLDAAILHRQPPPSSEAITHALTYARTALIPLLTRIWPLPDDLPHAAGMGDLPAVRKWFDATGRAALGSLDDHYPRTSPHLRQHDDLRWGAPTVQHVLDSALAWAVINRHFDVADFLLEHGANIDTDWNSHEPASILHHLVFLPDPYASMQFLIDRGIDMTIRDYRWNSHASGWARYGKSDEQMAEWLEEAERRRERGRSA